METKEAYQQKAQAQLDEWSAKMDALEAKARKAEADAHIRYCDEIEQLRIKKQSLQEQLNTFKNTSGDALETAKVGIEKAASDLKNSLNEAVPKFK